MDLKSRLESHSLSTLKKEISKTNVKGYSKMKKAEVVALMLKHSDRFNHIQHADTKKSEPKKEEPKKVKKIIKKSEPKEEPKKVKKIIKKPEPKEEPKNDNEKVKEFVDKLSNNLFEKDIKNIKTLLNKSGAITKEDMLKADEGFDDEYSEKVRNFLKNKNQTIYKKGRGANEGKFLVGNYEDNLTDKQAKEYDELYSKLKKRREITRKEEQKRKKK